MSESTRVLRSTIQLLAGAFFVASLSADVSAGDHQQPDPFARLSQVQSKLFDVPMVSLRVDGHAAFVLVPGKPANSAQKPWVWYAPTVMAEREEKWISPGARHAWIFQRLLNAGIYVVGVDVGESYGSLNGVKVYGQFYRRLVDQYRFAPRPGLLGISRGGLMAYNWAVRNPRHVACIGAIYPLCNLAAYRDLPRIAQAYQMPLSKLHADMQRLNPADNLRPLAAAHVPILHLHGDSDAVVPLETQSRELQRRYRNMNGAMRLIVVPGKGHEVANEYWHSQQLIDFFIQHLLPSTGK